MEWIISLWSHCLSLEAVVPLEAVVVAVLLVLVLVIGGLLEHLLVGGVLVHVRLQQLVASRHGPGLSRVLERGTFGHNWLWEWERELKVSAEFCGQASQSGQTKRQFAIYFYRFLNKCGIAEGAFNKEKVLSKYFVSRNFVDTFVREWLPVMPVELGDVKGSEEEYLDILFLQKRNKCHFFKLSSEKKRGNC